MMIIAHRGASGVESENTIRSFQRAQEQGADMIETDLRLRFDGEIVLSHNADRDPKKLYPHAPNLAALLQIANRPLNLEIKEAGFESQILAQIKNFPHKVVISSWNPWVLKKIRTLDGKIELGPAMRHKYRFFLPIIIRLLKPINISWITLDVALVNESRMKKFANLGWKVYVFTNDDPKIFNDPQVYQRLKDLGVDGIFTDYPDIVSKLK